MKLNLTAALPLALLFPAVAAAQTTLFSLDEIVFSGNLTELDADRSGLSIEVITEEDLEAAGEVQISDYLARLPGLNVTRDGPVGQNSFPRIRGLDGRYITVRINGIDVNDPSLIQNQTNFGGLTTANISRIEVLYGSQSALYGSEAVAGVIDIRTTAIPDEVGDELGFSIEGGSYDTAQAAFSYAVRGERGGLAFSATRLVTEGFSAAEEGDGNTEADGHRATTLSFSGEYDVTDTVTIGVDTFWQDSFTEFDEGPGAPPGPFNGDGPQTQDVTQRGARLYAEIEGGAVDHEFSLSDYETERFFPLGFFQRFIGERTEMRYVGTWEFAPESALSFGLERSEERFMSITSLGSVSSAEIDVTSAIADIAWAVSSNLDLSLSGRIDDHSRFGTQHNLRAALALRPDADTVIRASVGQGTRAPSLFELFSDNGNPGLSPETSLSVDLGMERSFGDLRLGATVFWIQVNDLIGFDGTATFCASPFGCYVQVPGETTTQGVELAASYDVTERISAFGTYTYTDTETASGARLTRVPRHQLSLGVAGELDSGWRFSVAGIGAADTAVSTFATNQLDDYFVVNANVGYELSDGVEAYLRVDNLFDTEYQTSPGFGTSDRAVYLGLRSRF
ncbi:TonB-dependent receptor plug domain-containing protein [Roseicyclus sp.]